MLNLTKCNLFLIGTVITLLLIAILVGIKILFSDSNLDLGSLADWISSVSAIGTLGVAWLAYSKADDYIDKKASERGIDILVNMVTESFVAYFNSLNETNFHASKLENKMILIGLVDEKIDCNIELQSLREKIITLFENSHQIDKDFIKMKIMKISKPSDIFYDPVTNDDTLQALKLAFHKLNTEICENENQYNINNALLSENINFIKNTTEKLAHDIRKQFFTSPNTYKDYFGNLS
ncbi:hypothetical protein IGU62_002098 [Escherichia coli]|uniref:hypothetical protein n=1 Tax=Escherichia coli TaxID=562 RepID=UPI000DA4E33D|nr:hypothetical protein [Escherichia coli]EFL9656600.1 hypothetical protein [Escherichia coli]EGL8705592.1 hypothetical protein [Escherichia coli]EKH9549084.1 hypothetical protein [Escherichia coli]EMB0435176.1 hypothetical protein [Escherichia coli]NJU52068.1 hypothetical protein [Escherichia coli]